MTKKIQGFQATTVTEVPEQVRSSRGIYAEIVEAVPPAPKALCIDFVDAKKAGQKVTGLRGFLRRHARMKEFTVVRQGSKVFVSRTGEEDAEEAVKDAKATKTKAAPKK